MDQKIRDFITQFRKHPNEITIKDWVKMGKPIEFFDYLKNSEEFIPKSLFCEEYFYKLENK